MRRAGAIAAVTLLSAWMPYVWVSAHQARDPEEVDRPAPVLVEGEPIIWITSGVGPYSAEFRANRVRQRLDETIRDPTLADPVVTVVEVGQSSEVRAGSHLLMVVTTEDAAAVHVGRTSLAQQYAHSLEAAIRTERQRYTPAALARAAILALVSTVIFGAFVWLLLRVSASIRRRLRQRLAARLARSHVVAGDLARSEHIERMMERIGRVLQLLVVLLAFNVYLTHVLGLFPWTRATSHQWVQYAITPIRSFGTAFVEYLPNLLFLAVVLVAVYVAIRLVSLLFRQIELGRLVFDAFPPEWASPTNKIVRVLLIAFGAVIAFPYLPASKSPAFTGVSVFIGVLVSLSSSSALSNVIAGIVLTYTGAFRLGDRARIGDTIGDITETALLATRIRTIKNEEVTIPNAIVLGSAVVNYTREAKTRGLILHTSVTIGYDAQWRQVHDLLIDAARGTTGILATPPPFVWQTALNDFYATYELNAYTALPQLMYDIYAELHTRIQDAFCAAGVEIVSPHYTSLRDGNAMVIPEGSRPPDHRARSFRVETSASAPAKSHGL